MTKLIEIHWTCGSLDEARRVSRYLVQERYVACAQLIPWIESVYMWNNQLETTQESKVIFKTHSHLFEKVKEIILQNCKYAIPEITAIPIELANKNYVDWMHESINQ